MNQKRHKGNTKGFSQMTWKEQASSISASILYLERAVKSHINLAIKDSRDANAVRKKCIRQIIRMLLRLI